MVRDEDQLGLSWLGLKVWLLSLLVTMLKTTWRVHTHGREVFVSAMERGGAVIAFWHGEQLPLVPIHASRQIAGLASLSTDGTLLANVIARLGYTVVRGSSSHGGAAAYAACRAALAGSLSPALALDGPRGPRHRVHTGAVRLSRETGAPILLMVSRARHAVRLKSWDRFQIPMPGTRVDVAYGQIPASVLANVTVEEGCRFLQAEMLALGDQLRTDASAPSAG